MLKGAHPFNCLAQICLFFKQIVFSFLSSPAYNMQLRVLKRSNRSRQHLVPKLTGIICPIKPLLIEDG